VIIGYIITDGITNVILTTEIEKEKKKPFLQLEENLKNLPNNESKDSDSEKINDEKLILKQKNETEEIERKKSKDKKDAEKNYLDLRESFAKTLKLQKK
jgi:hypothetical protein